MKERKELELKEKKIEKTIVKEECPFCGKEYANLKNHRTKCEQNPDNKKELISIDNSEIITKLNNLSVDLTNFMLKTNLNMDKLLEKKSKEESGDFNEESVIAFIKKKGQVKPYELKYVFPESSSIECSNALLNLLKKGTLIRTKNGWYSIK